MKKHHALYIAVVALTLGGCGSAGGSLANAITDPFTPKPHGKSSLAINQDPNNGILNVGHTVADTVEINGRTYGNNSTLDIGHNFQNRLSDFTYVLKQSGRNVESGQLGVYKRAYSAVVGATVQDRYNPNTGAHASSPHHNFSIRSIQGDLTPESRLPTSGSIRYQGHVFSGLDDRGPNGHLNSRLDYTVDFGNRTGSGSITGLSRFGNIELAPGRLDRSRSALEGDAISQQRGRGHYELNIFGPNADEIAGKATGFTGDHQVGFSGSKTQQNP